MRSRVQPTILICLLLIVPTFLFASNSAMLTAMGAINGSGNISSALFVGNLVETQPDSVATINSEGSMVLVQPDSSVQFLGNSVDMEHGGVVVTTWKGMAVKVGRFIIAPLAPGASKFEVSDSGGTVQIVARQGNVTINDGVTTAVLQEGQQTSRQEVEVAKERGAPPAASGFHKSKKKLAAFLIAGAAGGTAAGIVLAERGNSRPVSPAIP